MRGEGPGRRGAGPLGADAPPPRARARAALQPSGAPRGPVAQEGAPQQGGCRGASGLQGEKRAPSGTRAQVAAWTERSPR